MRDDNPFGLALQPDTRQLTLPRFLEDVAARHGDRPALRFEGHDTSYRALAAGARELARALLAAGVVKGARVGLLLGNRPEWVVAAYGAALAGAVLVPVNTFATAEEREYILRHGDVSLLLLQRTLAGRDLLAELLAQHPALGAGEPGRLRCTALPQLRRVVCFGLEAPLEAQPGIEPWETFVTRADEAPDDLLAAAEAGVTPADDALIVYTSGTTAQPKGILHTQRAPVIQSWRFAELMGLTPEDRVYGAQPFFWTAGMAMSLGATLAAGACLVLQELFEPGAALDLLEAERVTTLHAWPHQEKALVEQILAEPPRAADRDLSRLRRLEFSSPLARVVKLEKDEWGTHAAYGLSETFTLVSALPAAAPAELRHATHGRPLPGNTIRILDPETGEPLAPGEKGEIAVKGPTLMRGYYKVEPELCLDAEGFFRTQDAGWLDEEGFLHWTGRLSNLVKTGGANVSPLEIEQTLTRLPGLRLGVALGVPHPTLGEALVLCAVRSEGAWLSEDDVRQFLRAHLAAYKVPRRVLFLEPDEIAYTGSRKVQLAPLREAALRRLEDEAAEIAGFCYARSSPER